MGSLNIINKLYVWMATPLCRHTQRPSIAERSSCMPPYRGSCSVSHAPVALLTLEHQGASLSWESAPQTLIWIWPYAAAFLAIRASVSIFMSCFHGCVFALKRVPFVFGHLLWPSWGRVGYALCVQWIQQLMFIMCRLSVTVPGLDYSCLCSCNQLPQASLVRNHTVSG